MLGPVTLQDEPENDEPEAQGREGEVFSVREDPDGSAVPNVGAFPSSAGDFPLASGEVHEADEEEEGDGGGREREGGNELRPMLVGKSESGHQKSSFSVFTLLGATAVRAAAVFTLLLQLLCAAGLLLLRPCYFIVSQKLLWQIVSVLQWCVFNIIMILVNNEIFQKYGFTFPLTLTAIHFLISYIGAYVAIEVVAIRPKAEVDHQALMRWVLPMAAVSCFNVVLGQLSVRYIPLPTLLLTKALAPGLTVAIQILALGSEFNPWVFVSLLPVMAGMVMANAGEAQLAPTSVLFSALGSVVLGCATVVCAEVLLQGSTFNLDSINALYQMVPYSALIMTPPALMLEGTQLLSWFYSLLDPLPALSAILISGLFAFCLNFSLFYTIQNTSALTFNVAGNLKMAVSLVFARILFHTPLTPISILGCLVEVVGVVMYGWALFEIKKSQIELVRTDSERERFKETLTSEEIVDVYLGAML